MNMHDERCDLVYNVLDIRLRSSNEFMGANEWPPFFHMMLLMLSMKRITSLNDGEPLASIGNLGVAQRST